MRLAIYGGISSMLAAGVMFSAMYQRPNFYSACIYISKSSTCIMILLNLGLVLCILLGKMLQSIFFGELRTIEHMYERSWYAVTETCLAMTVFREEFDLRFVITFTALLFLKIFHWLCLDRVEYMGQAPVHRVTFHVRMVNLMTLLLIVDGLLANHAIQTTLRAGRNVMIMFGFEYTILLCTLFSIIGKYAINIIDMRSEEPWDNKSMYMFYLELVTDFLRLIAYLIFFFFVCFYYQLPLHIVRDIYVTFRSFVQKCRDLYRYRRATRNMNDLYPSATTEDLSGTSDNTCIICREEMQVIEDAPLQQRESGPRHVDLDQPKKLPCGHIFHFRCLRSWLERQQSCPTCRRSVLSDNTSRNEAGQRPPRSNDEDRLRRDYDQPQPTPSAPPATSSPRQAQAAPSTPASANMPPTSSHASNPPYINVAPPDNSTASPNIFVSSGLIPLVPLSSMMPPPQTGYPSGPTSYTLPETLTDEQINELSKVTREAMVQRLQILEGVQNQIFQTMQVLSEALSVLPAGQPRETASAQGNPTETTPTTTVNAENDDEHVHQPSPATNNVMNDTGEGPSQSQSWENLSNDI